MRRGWGIYLLHTGMKSENDIFSWIFIDCTRNCDHGVYTHSWATRYKPTATQLLFSNLIRYSTYIATVVPAYTYLYQLYQIRRGSICRHVTSVVVGVRQVYVVLSDFRRYTSSRAPQGQVSMLRYISNSEHYVVQDFALNQSWLAH